jgi:enoyl-[acyl-carrier protein] reductase III
MSFEGKVALITGGSRGIGRDIVLKLAERKVNVVINYLRNEEAALEVKKATEAYGVQAHVLCANVGDTDEIKMLFAKTKEIYPKIDYFIHNAALGAFKPVMSLRENQWDMSLNVNTKGMWRCTQEAVKLMEGRKGKIVTLSSLGSQSYIPDYGAIGISKAALESLVRYLAVELAPKNISVNCVSGGPIQTDALKMFPKYEQMKEECVKRTPMGRLGQPEDMAKVVLFLLSDESDWIVGQTIIADGGLSLF